MAGLEYTLRLQDLYSKSLDAAIRKTEKLDKLLEKINNRGLSLPSMGGGGSGSARGFGGGVRGWSSSWNPEKGERMLRRNQQFQDRAAAYLDEARRLDAKIKNKQSGGMSTLGAIGAGAGAYFGTQALINFGKSTLDALKNYEYFHVSVVSMMGGQVNAAKALETQLVNLAKESPFDLHTVQQGTKQMLSYGFAASEVVTEMKRLGDVGAATNVPLQDLVYVYGTLKSQGRAYQRDLNQFTMRGINLLPQLAKQFKTTTEGLKEFVKEGKVGFADVQKAIKAMTSEGGLYFKQMDEAAKTVGGRLERLGDSWTQFQVEFGKSKTGLINWTIEKLQVFVDKAQIQAKTGNFEDEAFDKARRNGSGVKGFSWYNKVADFLSLGKTHSAHPGLAWLADGKGKTDMFARSMQSMYVNPSSRSLVDALRSQSQLLNLKVNFGKAFINKEIDKKEYDRSMALMEHALDLVKGNIELFKKKPDKPDGGSEKKKEDLTGINTHTGRQDITIIVNDGIGNNMTVQMNNSNEDPAKLKQRYSELLLEVLNDANSIAKNR